VLPSIKVDNKIENDMNISNKVCVTTTPQRMETDEHEMKKTCGDEKMDLEESCEDEPTKCISRILDASWNDNCGGSNLVKDTMVAIQEGSVNPDFHNELISEVINEMIRLYLSSELTKEVEVNSTSDQILSSRMRNDDIEMDRDEIKARTQTTKTCTAKEASLYYLIASFNRASDERVMTGIAQECRQQLIKYAISLLDHDWLFDVESTITKGQVRSRSPLLQIMYDDVIAYQEFVRFLITEIYNKHPKRFTKVFNVILDDIYLDMRCKQIKMVDNLPTHSIDRLNELISMGLLNNDSVKPICNLVVSHQTFMPALCTEIPGREISHVSYLSPFLSITILVFDKYYDDNNSVAMVVQQSMQQNLEFVRSKLHSLFYNFLSNKDTRDTVLKYIGELLKQNAKRTQYNADERSLAQDGFMINLMAVMQKLAMKVKLDKVDQLYPFHPQSLVNIVDDTKLRFESSDYHKLVERLKMEIKWEDPKFNSHCFFFTLHAHHLGIIPAISRYHKRLRAIKELQRMVDELNATKPRWENTPYERRNRQARDKWVNRIKKLTKAKNTAEIIILDPGLNRNCLIFYSSVCEYLLHQMEGRKKIEGNFYNQISPNQLQATDEFSSLPTWYIEDIADYLLFLLT
jgi:ubiquitin conjugation factor E4 B